MESSPLGSSMSGLLEVSGDAANSPPSLAAELFNQRIYQNQDVEFRLREGAFSDPDDGDTLTYAATKADGEPLPSWLSFDAVTQTFSGTPGNSDVGVLSIKVTATDTSGATAFDVFDLTIENVNDEPTLDGQFEDQYVLEDVAYSYTFPEDMFSDIDAGQTLSYSAWGFIEPLPGWLDFDPETRTFTGTPTGDRVGEHYVEVWAQDGYGGVADGSFIIHVTGVNDAPVANDENYPMAENQVATINVLKNDTDEDSESLAIAGAIVTSENAEVTINSNGTLSISYTGVDLAVGESATVTIDYTVSDGELSDVGTLTMTVEGEFEDGDDIIGDDMANTLEGSDLGEAIFGFGRKDVINANGGDDDIFGGKGNDRLSGGDGADTFHFAGGDGKDRISDFSVKDGDIIDLSGIGAISGWRDLVRHHLDVRGDDLLIVIGYRHSIRIEDTDRSDIGRSDFEF
jgi:Ca2+-binding RTX toxin-like protein